MLGTVSKKLASMQDLVGVSGRRYAFVQLLQERPNLGRVWLAKSDNEKFILKDIPESIHEAFQTCLKLQIKETRNLRLPFDHISNCNIFAYRYLTDEFLTLIRNTLPVKAKKEILKSSLQGLVDLHDRDIVHLDIKPDNIMADCHGKEDHIVVDKVQLTDLENAGYLPRGRCIKGMLAGNENWRSPEAHLKGELNKPTDIFSFGAVCIYAMLGRVIFGPDDDFNLHVAKGAFPGIIRLQRQVSYFGDRDGINGLMKHVGDEETNLQVLSLLWDDRFADYLPYSHFSDWSEVQDAVFKDLVLKMMSLDPVKRITAREALEHPWFDDVDFK